ncbi:hypothetical protein QZH41_012849 [Actinostola sp. cb2023]|nr:hypothetical protein QZH41_012849 [Actinostola sp. cb2023]
MSINSSGTRTIRLEYFIVFRKTTRRGRKGQRQLKPSSFKFEVDPSGRKFVTMTHDELTKNHPGGVGDVSSTEKYARMYETEDVNDGYKALELYISKLNPKCDSLFQYPRRNWSVDDSDNVCHSEVDENTESTDNDDLNVQNSSDEYRKNRKKSSKDTDTGQHKEEDDEEEDADTGQHKEEYDEEEDTGIGQRKEEDD